MTDAATQVTKIIYILSDNSFLLTGVEALLPVLCNKNLKFTVKQVPNCKLHNFLAKPGNQSDSSNAINYFIAEKHVFYTLKLKNMLLNGILISPTVTLRDLERILENCNNPTPSLTSDCSRNAHSHREVEVVSLLLEGLTQKNIADRLGISIKTVSHHKQVAIRKSGFSNFNEYYLRNSSIHSFIGHH
ncbi:LuxR C-terminal-related transcriptional regulator [Buttiauxella brennerae]|uniref:LuxR C-terminal-related transcriptional regulator n=1 Tax=Buttiauxella brennerae TaxID=82988 RepID=UPI00286ED96C|nr:LuxR C-terminal-related transcriptional regulator [Buttiauxella brennerae]